MSAHYASPADWDVAAKVIASNAEANETCAAAGLPHADLHEADAAALRRVLASIATRGDARTVPAPSRFAGKHCDMARLVVGDQ
jgi:hypothetical protein